MSLDALLIHEVTIYNVSEDGPEDRYGNPTTTETAETVRARIEPTEIPTELLIDRDTSIAELVMFLAPSTFIKATSEVGWDGTRYRVVGDPRVDYGAATAHHQEVDLQRITG